MTAKCMGYDSVLLRMSLQRPDQSRAEEKENVRGDVNQERECWRFK